MPKIKDLGITVLPEQFKPPEIGGGGGCGITYCTDCTNQPYSICGTSPGPCSDCTTRPYSICGTTPCGGRTYACTDCTNQPYSICGTSPGPACTDCTKLAFSICGTTRGTVACRLGSKWPTVFDVTTPCGGSYIGPETIRVGGGGLRVEDVQELKAALREQIEALDEFEKTLGPQTAEEIDAREKQLTDELAKLKGLRATLKKK